MTNLALRQHVSHMCDTDPVRAIAEYFGADEARAVNELPRNMRPGLARWILLGIYPGDFLTGVIENDLMRAITKADTLNRDLLDRWVRFLFNHAPIKSWGSFAIAEKWHEQGGILGRPVAA